MKVKRFHYSIFGYRLFFIDTTDFEQAIKKYDLGVEHNESNLAQCIRSTIPLKNGDHGDCVFILIDTKDKYTRVSTLCHESIHACNWMLEKISHVPSYLNDEIQANLTEDIFDKLYEFYLECINEQT